MFSELLMALGLSVGLAVHGLSPFPIAYTARELPQSCVFVPDSTMTMLNVIYNNGVLHTFDIDFVDSSTWNATPVNSSGDTFLVDGCTYVLYSADFSWSYVEDSDYETTFVLNKIRVAQFFTSTNEFFQTYYNMPFAWSSWYSGQFLFLAESNTNVFERLQPISPAYNWNDSYSWNGGYFIAQHSAQPMSGSSPSYNMSTVSFQTFRSRVASICYSYALSGYNSYQNGWSAGQKSGYADGKRDGRAIGYEEGINATAPSALAGSLFGSVIAIPFDVLNGLNEFVIWGMPVISILISFLMVALIVAIIKRFV